MGFALLLLLLVLDGLRGFFGTDKGNDQAEQHQDIGKENGLGIDELGANDAENDRNDRHDIQKPAHQGGILTALFDQQQIGGKQQHDERTAAVQNINDDIKPIHGFYPPSCKNRGLITL